MDNFLPHTLFLTALYSPPAYLTIQLLIPQFVFSICLVLFVLCVLLCTIRNCVCCVYITLSYFCVPRTFCQRINERKSVSQYLNMVTREYKQKTDLIGRLVQSA